MRITQSILEQTLTFHLSGRLDSLSSSDLQEQLISALDQYQQVILDFEHVQYISSAGLRILLMAQKTANRTQREFMLTGVSQMVGEILEQTGFSEMIKVK